MNIKHLSQLDFHKVKNKLPAFQHRSQASKQGTEEQFFYEKIHDFMKIYTW